MILYVLFQLVLMAFLIHIIREVYLFYIAQREDFLPYVPTRRHILQPVFEEGVLRTCSKIVDLGCGMGTMLIHIRKQYPSAELTGVEHNRLLYIIARVRFAFHRFVLRRKPVRIVLGDMFEHNIEEYDAIVGFWLTSFMPRLLEKFQQEAKENIVIVSHLFQMPSAGVKAGFQEQIIKGKRPVYLYRRNVKYIQ